MNTPLGAARWVAPLLLALAARPALHHEPRRRPGDPVPVRFNEGAVHGFLELRTAAGALLAAGDLYQQVDGGILESRMVFRFPDSSLFDETVSFAQRGVFALRRYHLVQRGPAFAGTLDASFERPTGAYRVISGPRGGRTSTRLGRLDLPDDIANGMVITIAKNLAAGDTQVVHVVAFTPAPRIVALRIAPEATQRLTLPLRGPVAVRFALHPQLGALAGLAARIAGRFPGDSHTWIVAGDIPAFARFEGPLYEGPAWRIDVVSPRWPDR